MCVCYSHQYNFNVNMIRLSHTYGPGIQLDGGRFFGDEEYTNQARDFFSFSPVTFSHSLCQFTTDKALLCGSHPYITNLKEFGKSQFF